jgi:hypothetical protein
MRDEEEIERLLAQVSVPCLREGPHREQLKAELLHPTHPSERKGEEPMRTTRPFRATRLMKWAAGVLIAAALVATGWTAEKVYQSFAKKDYYVELEKFEEPPVILPDGSMMGAVSVVGTYVPADAPPGSVEKAKKDHEEMKQLIAQKKYKLIKTFEGPSGRKQYVYRFTLADGTHHNMNFSIPLENVASWEDYCQKSTEQEKQRREKIFKAFAADRFRLLDVEPLSVHLCRDVDSNQKLLAQRIPLSDGKEIASVRPEAASAPRYKTSWEDHLQAIRQGKRVLLDLQITKHYTYEVTLDDGSTTTFQIGSDGPAEALAERLRQRASATAGKDR